MDRTGQKVRTEQRRPGQVLDELEGLSNSRSESTIEAEAAGTRVMAVPVDSLTAILTKRIWWWRVKERMSWIAN